MKAFVQGYEMEQRAGGFAHVRIELVFCDTAGMGELLNSLRTGAIIDTLALALPINEDRAANYQLEGRYVRVFDFNE